MRISTTIISVTLSAVLVQACSLQKIDPVNWGEAGATSGSGGEAGDNATGGKSSKGGTSGRGGSSTKPTSKGGTSNATDAGGTSSTGGNTSQGGATTPTTTTPSCTGSETRSCALAGALGTCANGTQTCASGAWGECSIKPATTDNCTPGNDDTCNGKPNETPCKVKQIVSGSAHVCALLSDSMVRCWGDNSYGQLGNGSKLASSIPMTVPGLTNVTTVAASADDTCVIATGGSVICWGDNTFNQLGSASTSTGSGTPVTIQGVSPASSITVGYRHICTLSKSNGGVQCWGDASQGKVGNGSVTTGTVSAPHTIPGIAGATSITAGYNHTCTTLGNGKVACWGDISYGNPVESRLTGSPQFVSSTAGYAVNDITYVTSHGNGSFVCGLTTANTVTCWGFNSVGEIASDACPTESWCLVPATTLLTDGSVLKDVKQVSTGLNQACAIKTDGSAYCWGDNWSGVLGDGSTTRTNRAVPMLLANVDLLAPGGGHNCAVLKDGSAWCWGWNGHGQVGDGTVDTRLNPVKVKNLLP